MIRNPMTSKEKSNDIELIKKQLTERFKIPFWKRVYDFFEIFVVFFLLVLAVILIVVILIYLIDNPVSLAIICATIVILFVVVKLR